MKTYTHPTFGVSSSPEQIASSGMTWTPTPSGIYPRHAGAAVQRFTGSRTRRRSAAEKWARILTPLIILTWAASFVIGFPLAVSVLMFIGFAAAIFGLRRPALGLMGISMLCTMDAISRTMIFKGGGLGAGFLRFNTINYYLILVVLLSLPFVLRLKNLPTRVLQLFILLLTTQLILSPSFRTFKGGASDVLNIIAVFGLIVYIARAVARSGGERNWYWVALVNGVLAAFGSLAFYAQKGSVPYINPNVFAYFPVAGLGAICVAFRFASGRGQYILGLLGVMNLVWVFLSGSRGALLVAALYVLFVFLEMRGLSRRSIFLGIAGLLCIVAWAYFAQQPLENRRGKKRDMVSRIETLLDSNQSLRDRTANRSDLAVGAWHIFRKNPFGVGTGAFQTHYASLGMQEGMSGALVGAAAQSHSGWLKTLAENGIPGILVLTCFVLSFTVSGWQKKRQGLLPLGLLITGVLALTFISQEFDGKAPWFPVAAAIVLLHRDAIAESLRRSKRRRSHHRYGYRYPATTMIRPRI